MKRIIALTMVIMLAVLALSACNNLPDEHEHSFSTAWTSNETHHWHKATCDDTSIVSGQAAHKFVDNKCVICGYEQKTTVKPSPNPKPTPSTSAEVFVTEYILEHCSNFSMLATVKAILTSDKPDLKDDLFSEKQYYAWVDGTESNTKARVSSSYGDYYFEESDGHAYVYSKDQEQEDLWHKEIATDKEIIYPTDIKDKMISWLSIIEWTKYNKDTGELEGEFKYQDRDYYVECTLTDDYADISIYTLIQYIIRFDVIKANFYDFGTTTVTLPDNVIDDTVTTEPELPPETEQ